ncbi:short-chain dehydrogenase/reductase family protein [Cavenderia fasciculata]|uniref:Short-chain dehydrogenase/reductase family protein n=1 Tax=Cavenderia fasciculata TaxID=261658 RepID=F4QEV0_CACFS|nr:short-chain dehydrogenase/reductase family protein [Cavenderia fasciculata]EGG14157.1 short-chain dehydrogenase/reductase family protein [Cavenderia fasciculata]|eukprot:XP_004350865.1 short-chain dehydrogenase/reductase family protein [Cavenderia fasciculata]
MQIEEEENLCCYQCDTIIRGIQNDSKSLGDRVKVPLCELCTRVNQLKWTQWDSIDVSLTMDGTLQEKNKRYALVTGGRMKIGFHIALRLLKSGFTVMVTTRFPWVAANSYKQEPDYSQWGHRLHVYGVDFRHLPSVQSLVQNVIKTFPRLDILINNAAQTIRRPRAYYHSLLNQEQSLIENNQSNQLQSHFIQSLKDLKLNEEKDGEKDREGEIINFHVMECSKMTQIELLEHDKDSRDDKLYPVGRMDVSGQQVDMRKKTTWRETIQETSPIELLEVQLINCTVPFMLISQLSHLMTRPTDTQTHYNDNWRFIINVSAQEGSFTSHSHGRGIHVHSNMAKASLNMMTYSIAESYLAKSIYVCGVDTGWCSKMTAQDHNARSVPLNDRDGACRILDPIFQLLSSNNESDQESKQLKTAGFMFRHYRLENNNDYSGKYNGPIV